MSLSYITNFQFMIFSWYFSQVSELWPYLLIFFSSSQTFPWLQEMVAWLVHPLAFTIPYLLDFGCLIYYGQICLLLSFHSFSKQSFTISHCTICKTNNPSLTQLGGVMLLFPSPHYLLWVKIPTTPFYDKPYLLTH